MNVLQPSIVSDVTTSGALARVNGGETDLPKIPLTGGKKSKSRSSLKNKKNRKGGKSLKNRKGGKSRKNRK